MMNDSCYMREKIAGMAEYEVSNAPTVFLMSIHLLPGWAVEMIGSYYIRKAERKLKRYTTYKARRNKEGQQCS